MVRVVVKRTSGVDVNGLPPGMTSSILDNDNKNYFGMDDDNEDSKLKNFGNLSRQFKLKKLSQVLGNLSAVNISNVTSPVIVETSVVVGGFALKEEVNPFEPEDVKLAFTSTFNMWIGILLMIIYLLPGAAIGPVTMSLQPKSPLIKALWRTQANLLMTLPLYFGMYLWSRKEMSIKRDHSFKMLLNSAITSIFDFFWYIGCMVGISMTITSHALVMYSSTNVYMFVFAIITGAGAHRFEYFGYGLFGVGVFLMLTDPFAVKTGDNSNLLLGDLIAFLSAGFGAILGLYNSNNAKIIHPITLYGQINFFSIFYQTAFACFILGPKNVISFSPELGMFGWLADPKVALFLLFVVAPFFGVLVNVCFYAAYHYWPMEIIAGTILLYPFLSQVVGITLGQDGIPGFRTLFGLTIVTIATLLCSYGSKLKAITTVQKICDNENIESKVQMSFLGSLRKISSEEIFANDSIEK